MPATASAPDARDAFIRQLPDRILAIQENWKNLAHGRWDAGGLSTLYDRLRELAELCRRHAVSQVGESLSSLGSYFSTFVGSQDRQTSPQSDTASYTATAAQVADPAISKAGDPTKASVGTTVTFTLTVTNQGTIPATDVVITDTLPAIFDVTAVTVTGAPFGTVVNVMLAIGTGPAPYTVVLTLGGDLGVEDIVTIRIVTTVNGQGNPPINNLASLTTSAQTDVITNNADSVTITIGSSEKKQKKTVLPATGFAQGLGTFLPEQPFSLAYAPTDVRPGSPSLHNRIHTASQANRLESRLPIPGP